jgi:ribosomal protein L11 methyltransferase
VGCAPDALEVRTGWQEHGDWARLWKRGLAPRRVTERLVVAPSWTAPELRPDDLLIVVDPGMAFGTAEHGTTRGCLRLLDGRVRPGDRILDVGAGSAILSIAAALLGAEVVHAVEMDELAVPTARENVAANGVEARVRVEGVRLDAEGVASRGVYDGVVANIEVGHLVPLLHGLRSATRPGGWLLLSGILAEEEEEVRALAEVDDFSVDEVDADGEWRSLVLERRGAAAD